MKRKGKTSRGDEEDKKRPVGLPPTSTSVRNCEARLRQIGTFSLGQIDTTMTEKTGDTGDSSIRRPHVFSYARRFVSRVSTVGWPDRARQRFSLQVSQIQMKQANANDRERTLMMNMSKLNELFFYVLTRNETLSSMYAWTRLWSRRHPRSLKQVRSFALVHAVCVIRIRFKLAMTNGISWNAIHDPIEHERR